CKLLVTVWVFAGRSRNNKRRTCFIDQDRVNLVHYGIVKVTLTQQLNFVNHVVSQIVKTKLVVCTVGNVSRVSFFTSCWAKLSHTWICVVCVIVVWVKNI